MYYNNKKLALSIFWVVLGLTLLVLNLVGVLDDLYSSMGIAPNPQSPIPNPQSPIPNPQSPKFFLI